ncbi:interleukin-1 receptor type 1-like [Erpetoichthys calabaricus]|nr:interleukin-1 receptor type 1-like [Erpetoichthys calabaricus]
MHVSDKMFVSLFGLIVLSAFFVVPSKANYIDDCEDLGNETLYTSNGKAYLIKCENYLTELFNSSEINFTWYKLGVEMEEIIGENIEVHNEALWFLPISFSDSGSYVCEIRTPQMCTKSKKVVLVKDFPCFFTEYLSFASPLRSTIVQCFAKEDVIALDKNPNIEWLKDCRPVQEVSSKMVQTSDGLLIPNVTRNDMGNYTCLINFTYKGHDYVTSSTSFLNIAGESNIQEPLVIYPQNKTMEVAEGSDLNLTCTIYLGGDMISHTTIYWTINHKLLEFFNDSRITQMPNREYEWNNEKYVEVDLLIRGVTADLYEIPLTCVVMNALARHTGNITLKSVDNHHIRLILFLAISGCILLLAVFVCKYFKFEIVLYYRKMCQPFKTTTDGKLYDAYVIYPKTEEMNSHKAETFALEILPEMLENKYGYKLFILGRNELPGEAIPTVIEETISKSRRLIIVLTNWCLTENHWQTICEQQIGLYTSLVKNENKVILIELDKNIQYSSLPESLQYIKKRQGVLQWNQACGLNGRFWKLLRYQMPAQSRIKRHLLDDVEGDRIANPF